ncbi:glycosyltransferase family 2 protein [Pseudogemmobacter sonorensis]|uniref:glycosyltransferase family 2 protein n=1 Tax=Pseudogemmobacter sonorensis TaxID=2989681 RepID=UPI00368D9504
MPDHFARDSLPERVYLDAAARHFRLNRIAGARAEADPRLIDRLGAATCLHHGLVPLRQAGAVTLVALARPERIAESRPLLEAALGPVALLLATEAQVEAAIHARRGAGLARDAEERVPARESCRHWGGPLTRIWWLFAMVAALAVLSADPRGMTQLLLALAILALLGNTGLKIAAALAALHRPERPGHGARPPPPLCVTDRPAVTTPPALPVVSIIVALHRESDIAARLVRRLSRLDYPRDLLDVCLAVEADDDITRGALAGVELPAWMRVVLVPRGRIQTKPRALNHALSHCRGTIIGVYDAEDAPEPAQIRKVVARFQACGPRTACLQGMLDYYNPRTNWLSRCFTLEYATWFRLILPGVARLGLAVPLGGTTLFFRRSALKHLGGWDAHNVTEDADLGLRLCRHGYRSEIIETVTREEANCRALPWVRQRSRWIKGYMMTWLVHMRDPVLLWRQLGPLRFWGVQVQFLGSVLQSLLAPLLWSFWILPLGLPHPLAEAMTPGMFGAMMAVFLLTAAVDFALCLIALRRSGHRLSPLWIPTLHGYFPLATLAAFKALHELATRPFYWDKTSHGHFDTLRPARPTDAAPDPAGSRPRAMARVVDGLRQAAQEGLARLSGHARAHLTGRRKSVMRLRGGGNSPAAILPGLSPLRVNAGRASRIAASGRNTLFGSLPNPP